MSDQQAPDPRRRTGTRLAVVAGVLAALAVTTGVVVLQQRQDAPRAVAAGSRGALPPLDVADPGVVHVHGLGVDPGDGTLYAATHSGLFALPETGTARRIANRYQDTMGFTVVGPGRFLGSGHPDPREDDVRPPLLGLIESTDAGTSWERLSLHGEADFHALQAAHGRVYGYDATSQTFMVSRDKVAWERRAQLALADFAVSPDEPDTVLATTQQGLARSEDGGRTFRLVPGAPALVTLAWTGPALFAAGPEGDVHTSADGGRTWTRTGGVGAPPEAMTVDVREGTTTLYVAAAERGVLISRDGGATFTVRYAET